MATAANKHSLIECKIRNKEDYYRMKDTLSDPKEIVCPVENCALLPDIVELW